MPFTANRQFKKNPRLLVKGDGVHYTDAEGRKIFDGLSGLWTCGAGHGRKEINEAVASQLNTLENVHNTKLSGIFLTHAHIGHYIGLLQLGREVMGAKNMPVYAMPKMQTFLKNNSPWNQLLSIVRVREVQFSLHFSF